MNKRTHQLSAANFEAPYLAGKKIVQVGSLGHGAHTSCAISLLGWVVCPSAPRLISTSRLTNREVYLKGARCSLKCG